MRSFGEVLVKIRLDADYKTSKAFYNYLESRGLDCNYQYYVKIEKDLVTPSSNLINQMAKALDRESAEKLVRAFCAGQFKSFDYLFQGQVAPILEAKTDSKKTDHMQGQKKLTEKQIFVLAQSKENYHLFLMMTLARKPLSEKDFINLKNFKKAISDLKKENILIVEDKNIQAASSEFLFPKADNPTLKKYYAQFDLWDKEFEEKFTLAPLINKMMIRRISPRYLSLIQKQIEVLTDIVRISDESDIRHNNQVIQLQIRLSHGDIPG